MSQNQEIIEAKLCGYIDNELDPQERVEIEKHLEANPQHRRLLESLKATRDLLKWLPRESAPPEVAETLNGQLERSVLLDEGTEALRPGIWPRIFAAAAIILLTAGLGIAVYLTLPKSQNNAVPYAANTPESAAPTTNEARLDETLARRSVVERDGMKDASVVSKVAAQPEERPELEKLAVVAGQNREAIVAIANGVNYSTNAANNAIQAPAANTMVMLVRSDSPQDTGKQLTTLLDAKKIEWKQAEGAGPASGQIVQQQMPMAQSAVPRQMASQSDSVSAKSLGGRYLEQQEQRSQSMPSATTQPAQQSQFGQGNSNFAFRGAPPDMFVARMSRQQAEQITSAISQESAQKAELKELERPALGAINGGAATRPANESQLSVRAMGGFAGVERGAGTAPTTQPAFDAALAKEQAPTSQPSDNLTEGDKALDIVIVVQPNTGVPAAPATSQPTTQPAGEQNTPQTQPAKSGQ